MTDMLEVEQQPEERDYTAPPDADTSSAWPSPIVFAALAAIGAGAIHAAAVGVHNEHRFLATMFVWAAAFQIGWGIAAMLRPTRTLVAIGLVGNALVVGFWLVSRLRGVSFIDGLEVREAVEFADAAAAGLGLVAIGISLGTLLSPEREVEHRLTNVSIPAFCIATLVLPTMVTAGTTLHTHTEAVADPGHSHGAVADTNSTVANEAVPHSHDVAPTTPTPTVAGPPGVTSQAPATTEAPAVVPPKPYDPSKPIDLSGVDGVSEEQQARAENLIAITLNRLPQFADYKVAESQGWQSIGDCITGFEHFINTNLFADGRELDPDYPESLVYENNCSDEKQLVSAMFMAEPGVTLENVPDVGGKLTQWHIHNNLCFTADGRVGGLKLPGGTCQAPLVDGPEIPMIHVWIVPNACGPFAALEGVGAGQILPGEERWCDHAHGAGG